MTERSLQGTYRKCPAFAACLQVGLGEAPSSERDYQRVRKHRIRGLGRTTTSALPAFTLAVVLLASSNTAAQQTRTTQDTVQLTANSIVTELSQIVHGTARTKWRALVPSATWRDRRGPRDYPPASVQPQPRGLWCSMATDMTNDWRRDAVFYGLRTERPYDCRLEHVRYLLEQQSGTRDLYDALVAAIGKRFDNEFATVDPDRLANIAVTPEMTGAKDAAPRSWVDVRFWMSGTRYIFLARAGSTVQVMSQTYVLSDALYSDRDLRPETRRYGVDLLKWEVANALRPTDPETVEVILSNEGVIEQNRAERAALRVLQARAKADNEDQRAMLSLASAFVVSRLESEGESWQRDRPGLKPILAYGVRMEVSPFDSDVRYGAVDFAEDVRRRRPGTHWGQLAFLDRLSRGWTEFPGGDQYRHVITQGTAWLKLYPNSPFAATVMGHVARAYETWWSLSLAPDDEDLVTAAEHKEGAQAARLQAIRWYERILRDAPTSVEARHARRVLVQITVGVDTGEREFYEVYA
jgi:hypothetical protein